MSEMTLNDFYDQPFNLVIAEPATCKNVDVCITHTWPVLLKKLSDYKPPCRPTNVVATVAIPQKKDMFRFVVDKGQYRLVHLRGWDYTCNADGITITRVGAGASECGDDSIRYDFPRSCPFTVLPPGTYDVSLFPVPVNVDNADEANGAELDVSIILESVDQQFVDAIRLMRG